MGEQNIYWNTHMYVQSVQRQQTKWLRRFLRGQTGLDRRDMEGSGLAPGVSGAELSGFRAAELRGGCPCKNRVGGAARLSGVSGNQLEV